MSDHHDDHHDATSQDTTGHVSRAKDPAIVEKSQRHLGCISSFFVLGALMVLVWMIFGYCSKPDDKSKDSPSTASTQTTAPLVYTSPDVLPPHPTPIMDIPPGGQVVHLRVGFEAITFGCHLTAIRSGSTGKPIDIIDGEVHTAGFQDEGDYIVRPNPENTPNCKAQFITR